MNSRAAAFVQAARGPVLLMLLGFLFALQQAGQLDFARSWPLLIIAIGCLKLLERVLGGPPPAAAPVVQPPRPPVSAYAPPAPYAAGYGQAGGRPPAAPPPGGPGR